MSRKLFVSLAFALFLIASSNAGAQTTCGTSHPNPGVFICYPNPAESPADANIPETFHVSAQVNPAEGQTVRRYNILIDDRVVYEGKLPSPLKKLSIETNLRSAPGPGSHSLSLVVYNVGSAAVSGLHTHDSPDSILCDPFSRTDPRACNLSKPTIPLRWQPAADNGRKHESADAYTAALHAYSRNLKRLEADASDAIAVDSHGNLYTASHVLSDVEVRKYSPDGGILYDSIVRSCGDGFVQVSAIAAMDSGFVWIAANTTACFKASDGTFDARPGQPNGMRGILILVDTNRAGLIAPPYLAWLAESEYRTTAIRTDSEGNAYVAGIAGSSDFPHQAVLDVDAGNPAPGKAELGFVSVLSKSGSVLWSTLLRQVLPSALSTGADGNVFVAGKETSGTSGAILAEVADRGRRLSSVVRSGAQDAQEFRAVSTTPNGEWVLLAGAAVAPQGQEPKTHKPSSRYHQKISFVAVRACRADGFDFHPLPQSASEEAPGIALGAALDSVAAEWLDNSLPACRPPA
jgi:hypothetical protein